MDKSDQYHKKYNERFRIDTEEWRSSNPSRPMCLTTLSRITKKQLFIIIIRLSTRSLPVPGKSNHRAEPASRNLQGSLIWIKLPVKGPGTAIAPLIVALGLLHPRSLETMEMGRIFRRCIHCRCSHCQSWSLGTSCHMGHAAQSNCLW